jgi:hypothetical protein
VAFEHYEALTCASIVAFFAYLVLHPRARARAKPDSQKQANKAHAKLRTPGERANAQLKTWKILTKLRCCPWRAGQLAKAIDVLQLREA